MSVRIAVRREFIVDSNQRDVQVWASKIIWPRLSLILALFILFVFKYPVFGQSPQEEFIRVTSNLVLVDARAVNNKTGKAVQGLTADDFEVFENGVRQEINHFSQNKLPISAVLLLDVSGSMQNAINQLYKDALRVLLSLNAGDEVALIGYGGFAQLLQEFSKDRKLIIERIGCANESYIGPRNTSLSEAVFQGSVHLAHASNPGSRRILIAITDDIARDLPSGRTKKQALDQLMDSGASLYGIAVVNQDSWVRDHPVSGGRIIPVGHAGDVRMRYFAEPTGGVVLPASPGTVVARLKDLLDEIRASYSIGYVPSNRTMNGEFRRIQVRLKDPHVVDEPTGEEIKPAVVARKGYFAGASSPTSSAPQGSIKFALPVMDVTFEDRTPEERLGREARFVRKGPRDFAMSVVPAIFLDARGEPLARLYFSLQPGGIRLKQNAGKYTSTFDLLAIVFTQTGMIWNYCRQDRRLALDETQYKEFLHAGTSTAIILELPPGEYQVRTAAIQLGSGKVSAARASLDVWFSPKGLPSISSIVFSRRTVPSGPLGAGPDDYDPLRLGQAFVVPSFAESYAPEGFLTVFFHVYNASDHEGVPYQYRLNLYRDKALVTREEAHLVQSEYRHAIQRYLPAPRLDLSGLTPGEYEVEVEVALPDGSSRVSRSASFRIN